MWVHGVRLHVYRSVLEQIARIFMTHGSTSVRPITPCEAHFPRKCYLLIAAFTYKRKIHGYSWINDTHNSCHKSFERATAIAHGKFSWSVLQLQQLLPSNAHSLPQFWQCANFDGARCRCKAFLAAWVHGRHSEFHEGLNFRECGLQVAEQIEHVPISFNCLRMKIVGQNSRRLCIAERVSAWAPWFRSSEGSE